MKQFLFITLSLCTVVQANESNCYAIKNTDQKNYCLAIAKAQNSFCYSVHESDLKNTCLGQVSNSRSYCYAIQSSDSKNKCLALVQTSPAQGAYSVARGTHTDRPHSLEARTDERQTDKPHALQTRR
jgi:hypothetical protein